MVILPLLGIADAGYLTYEKMQNQLPPCGSGFDCGEVLNSPYAMIGPIPLSVFGLLYYSLLLILGICHFLEIDFSKYTKHKKLKLMVKPLQLYTTVSAFGLLFSFYLVLLMGVIIKAWCLYCLVSAGISFLIFCISWTNFNLYSKHSHYLIKSAVHAIAHWIYTKCVKPLFFLLDAETAHNSCTRMGVLLGFLPLSRAITNALFAYQHPSLEVVKDGILFPNPIGLSAGFDYNGQLTSILPHVGIGFQTIGTVTLEAYEGNTKPRLGRFPNSKALLVNKGLKNIGAKNIIRNLEQKSFEIPVGISIAATNKRFENTKEQILDIVQCFVLFEKSSVAHSYYELNISCPNTFECEPFTTPARLEQLLTALDVLHISKPLYIKMPIDQDEKTTLQLLAVADIHNVQGVIFGNLTKDHSNPDVTKEDREVWKQKRGNLSGKPTFARSNALIALTRQHFYDRFTIIGTGGIFDAATAQQKIDAGADLLQLITGMIFEGPQLIGSINRELVTK